MIQNVIVAVIILIALTYVGYSIFHSLKPGPDPKSSCGGCTGWELKDLNKGCPTPVENIGTGKNNTTFRRKIRKKNRNHTKKSKLWEGSKKNKKAFFSFLQKW